MSLKVLRNQSGKHPIGSTEGRGEPRERTGTTVGVAPAGRTELTDHAEHCTQCAEVITPGTVYCPSCGEKIRRVESGEPSMQPAPSVGAMVLPALPVPQATPAMPPVQPPQIVVVMPYPSGFSQPGPTAQPPATQSQPQRRTFRERNGTIMGTVDEFRYGKDVDSRFARWSLILLVLAGIILTVWKLLK